MKHTKIIATIGPKSDNKNTIGEMIDNGTNIFRLNFSHGTHEKHKEILKIIREISDEKKKHIGILQDICGPKIRITKIDGLFSLKKDDIVVFEKNKTEKNSYFSIEKD